MQSTLPPIPDVYRLESAGARDDLPTFFHHRRLENIKNAIPLIEDAESIKIVSNSLHAEKGRAYLWKLRPDLADRLSRGWDYRLGEINLLKPAAAALGMKSLRSLRR